MENISIYSKIKASLRRLLPLFVLILLLVLFFAFGLNDYLSFAALKAHRNVLLAWTHEHYILVVLGFMACYIIAVAASVPGAVFFTLASGFLFGIIWGTLYVIISATIGATLLYFAVRTALGDWLSKKASDKVAKMRHGFQENAFSYLMILRLIPIFPFWLVNIVPALLNVPVRTFIFATFLGIIPGSFVYVTVGNSLGYVFDSEKTPDLSIIFTPPILLPLIGLALLSLLPLLYKRYYKK